MFRAIVASGVGMGVAVAVGVGRGVEVDVAVGSNGVGVRAIFGVDVGAARNDAVGAQAWANNNVPRISTGHNKQ